MARMARAALTTFHSPESWRASASLMRRMSTAASVRRTSSGLPEIQKFMVSQATSRGRSHLVEDLPLQHGIDVAEEDVLGPAVAVRDPRLEELEHVEVGADRLAGVEVVGVLALPVEGLPRRALQALEVDGPALEGGQRLLAEVVAHHRHQVHGGEEGRRPPRRRTRCRRAPSPRARRASPRCRTPRCRRPGSTWLLARLPDVLPDDRGQVVLDLRRHQLGRGDQGMRERARALAAARRPRAGPSPPPAARLLAVAAFVTRLWMIWSTVTASWSGCQQS